MLPSLCVTRRERGDWQTPFELAGACVARLATQLTSTPDVVLEPTCGEGAFLQVAGQLFPRAHLVGFDLSEEHVATARARLPAGRSRIERGDFFEVPWEDRLQQLDGSLLIIGNPPWVTSATLGSLASSNLPKKQNLTRLRGLDAKTGRSNFDLAEWMILRLLRALGSRPATLAMLCKASVARRVIAELGRGGWPVSPGEIVMIDAARHFDASVHAVWFVCRSGEASSPARYPVFSSLASERARGSLGLLDDELVVDVHAAERSAWLAREGKSSWRSGLKHDCAAVMELRESGGGLHNGLGERVEIEAPLLFPLWKSSDVARGESLERRWVVVPQRRLGESTDVIERDAGRAWRYLCSHRGRFEARRSSIYRGKPDFAIFGVGPYSFAPWKVATSGLHKSLRFTLIGPRQGLPVMFDDTCYFLPFETERDARRALVALSSDVAREFFEARVFWDDKRPIHKRLLDRLDLEALLRVLDQGIGPPVQGGTTGRHEGSGFFSR